MTTLTTMPKPTAAELLTFLADNESFSSAEKLLDGGITTAEVRALLRELAAELAREAAQEGSDKRYNVKTDSHLARKTKEIISYLSPHEEETLLSAFGIIEKD